MAPRIGFRHSKATKKKMSKSMRGRVSWNKGKKGVQTAWNKGLSKKTDKRVRKYANSLIGHGMSKAGRQKMSIAAKKRMTHKETMRRIRLRNKRYEKFGNPRKGRSNHWIIGRKNPAFTSKKRYIHFKYGKSIFRSSYELAFAKWCRKNKVKYRYEPKTFRLQPGPGRSHTYTPDFLLPENQAWIEVKGYLTQDKLQQLKDFKKAYPKISLSLVGGAALEAIGAL